MFSARFKWDLQTNALAQLLERKRAAGVPLFDLTEANPTRAGLTHAAAEILPALHDPATLVYEPAPRGLLGARTAVAEYYAERNLRVAPEFIHLTASTSEAYAFLFKLLCDHGDEIVLAQPSYPLFDFLATFEGVTLRPFALEYLHPHGWRIDFASLRAALTPRTRAIILVSPNNPTGSYVKAAELVELNALCQQHELALIVDEVFGDYALDASAQGLCSLVENDAALTFVLSGLSKILALPQMKLGWIVTNGPAALRAEARERLDVIADTYLSVSAPVQHAAATWLKFRPALQSQILQRVQANLATLRALCAATPCRVLQVEGGWYATLEVPRLESEETLILHLLAEADVLVHPGYFFDFAREGYLVLSLLAGEAEFAEAARRVIQHFAG